MSLLSSQSRSHEIANESESVKSGVGLVLISSLLVDRTLVRQGVGMRCSGRRVGERCVSQALYLAFYLACLPFITTCDVSRTDLCLLSRSPVRLMAMYSYLIYHYPAHLCTYISCWRTATYPTYCV